MIHNVSHDSSGIVGVVVYVCKLTLSFSSAPDQIDPDLFQNLSPAVHLLLPINPGLGYQRVELPCLPQPQYGATSTSTHVGTFKAPARWAVIASMAITRFRLDMIAAVSSTDSIFDVKSTRSAALAWSRASR
jgi:hypothetical protein